MQDTGGPEFAPESCVTVREKNLLSRLLYPNPVCLLSVRTHADQSLPDKKIKRNVMTISWLTPIDNYGNFICSINKKRYTTELVIETRKFVLNVPVHGQEPLIFSIGACSGRHCDKFDLLDVPTTVPGFGIGLRNGNSKDIRAAVTGSLAGVSESATVATGPPRLSGPMDSGSGGSARQQRRELDERRDDSQLIALVDVAAHIVCTVEGIVGTSTVDQVLANADEKESGPAPSQPTDHLTGPVASASVPSSLKRFPLRCACAHPTSVRAGGLRAPPTGRPGEACQTGQGRLAVAARPAVCVRTAGP